MHIGGDSMIQFHMVKYHKQAYPSDIPLRLEEVAGHFDIKKICPDSPYSLHTEYSYGSRFLKTRFFKSTLRLYKQTKTAFLCFGKIKHGQKSLPNF